MDVPEPSEFWQLLAGEHQRDLDSVGFSSFKRHQALRYFTWQWRWRSIHRSEQFRFLLSNSSVADLLRAALAPTPLSGPAWAGVPWTRRDRWLYTFAIRLLWAYAEGHDRAGITRLKEPEFGKPFPVFARGRLVSQDLANSALEVSAIIRALEGREPRSIVEVGAGYGRTAYALLNTFRDASYTIIDIHPAIDISRRYLTELFPDRDLCFIGPNEVNSLRDSSFDLAVSISSLQEMTLSQVAGYIDLLDRISRGGVVYLKQWTVWQNPVDRLTLEFSRYPIPSDWREMFRQRAPVQTRFSEAAWQLPT